MNSSSLKKLLLVLLLPFCVTLLGGVEFLKKQTVPNVPIIKVWVAVPVVPSKFSPKILSFIKKTCEANGVPLMLVYKLIEKESSWNTKARNYNHDPETAELLSVDIGLMQLNSSYIDWMVETFGSPSKTYNVRENTYDNVEIGIKYLSWLNKKMLSWRLAVMAYNCGPNKVQKGKIPLRTIQYANYIVPVDNWWESPLNVVLYYEG